MSKLVAPMQSIDTVHRSALTYIPFQITAARTIPESRAGGDRPRETIVKRGFPRLASGWIGPVRVDA